MNKLILPPGHYSRISDSFWCKKIPDRQSFHHSEGLGAPGGTPAASRECYRMNQHMKKYITKPVLSHLSSSPLLGLVHSLIGRPVFMCRLRETAAAHVVLTLYYHLFNGTGGSVAENVHSVTIHQGKKNKPHKYAPPPEAGLTPRSILLCADSS